MDFQVDVLKVLEQLQLEGDILGQEYVVRCPFHKDLGRPNLEINIYTGLWHCWVCGKKGNLVHLIMDIRTVSMREAIELLQENSNVPDIDIIRERNLRELDKIIKEQEGIIHPSFDISHLVGGSIWRHKFGNLSEHTVKRFRLGFDSASRRAVIPIFYRHSCVGAIFRSVREDQVPRYLYNEGLKRGNYLFAWDEVLGKTSHVIVTEGARDSLRLYDFGIEKAVSILGSSISSVQLSLLMNFDEVTLMLDNDPAGYIGTLITAKQLSEFVPVVNVAQYHTQKNDPNELTKGEAKRMLKKRIFWASLLQ